jgi:hypothetical protein
VVEEDGVLGNTEALEVGVEASEEIVVLNGLENFAGSGGPGTRFADSSRAFSNILEVSGVTEDLAGAFVGAGALGFISVFGEAGRVGAEGFGVGFATGGTATLDFEAVGAIEALFVALGVVFADFSVVFVDFALVADFFVSGNSISMGSDMTFLGLPLFLTTSADMMSFELASERRSLRI